ncbi:hypothetical protein [Tepidibacter thalassicus]|uniref:Uncharacterized protein n=1 Tax=Tepidibacter thalassicus DSM 15285 TaxID=1123350 RepID=A0A1M5TYZ3_9FIRM|nr:hypothetical protein [Tepidibacter thalassicus]SHH55830.1 hypothetical protein SAMN02744040_02341 [Tepidibacter thalassicus DSM 15285]
MKDIKKFVTNLELKEKIALLLWTISLLFIIVFSIIAIKHSDYKHFKNIIGIVIIDLTLIIYFVLKKTNKNH